MSGLSNASDFQYCIIERHLTVHAWPYEFQQILHVPVSPPQFTKTLELLLNEAQL